MIFTIRPMKPDDMSLLMHIVHQVDVFNQEDCKIAKEVLNTYLKYGSLSEYYVLVALRNDLLMGFICYGPVPLTTGTWDIYWLAVAPEARHQGAGKQLMAAAEKEMENASGRICLIETSSRPGYESARSLYTACGYQITAQIADFYFPGDDKLIYIKRFKQKQDM